MLTSASVHDSQGSIPLAQLSAQRVTALYALMDRAYDAPQIHAFSRQPGPVPIIAPHPRGGEARELSPSDAERFKERSAAERVNSLLKERYGARWGRVRGAAKVMCHLIVWGRGAHRHHALRPLVLKPSARAVRSGRRHGASRSPGRRPRRRHFPGESIPDPPQVNLRPSQPPNRYYFSFSGSCAGGFERGSNYAKLF